MTMTAYRKLLLEIRKAFPPPVSDPMHDGYVVFSLLRALDQVDALKSDSPLLGRPIEPDFAKAALERLAESGETVEKVVPELVQYLEGMLIWGHPRAQVNVIANPSIAGIIGVVLPALFNPNLCSDESGRRFSEVEARVSAMTAALVGYDPEQAGGLFTFGGTGALLYGARIGMEKASPGSLQHGIREPAVILASEQSHYACRNIAGWMGLGYDQVIRVPSHADNAVDIRALTAAAEETVSQGKKIACIVATMGTTDAFGVDDLQAIRRMRDNLVERHGLDYIPHLHADAVIGWAWSVFDDYDFDANPMQFRGRTLRALANVQHRMRWLDLADSIGVDFHKTGYAPYVSTLFLLRSRDDFRYIVRERETMPYLFHSGGHHPGMYSLETTRSAAGPMSALAGLLLFGKQGFRAVLGNAVEMAEQLREQIGSRAELTVLNHLNSGPVTLFRAYPDDVDTFSVKEQEMTDPQFVEQVRFHNAFNRRIFHRVHAEALAGRGVAIGLTENYRHSAYGEPVVALKSYVLSPFADAEQMDSIIEHVLAARDYVLAEMATEQGE
ncbi:pyridoxal phosphate-dependent decarboxylase family protein [Lignipirellula cremea]|uniref:L-2,4-diaminobutyrate decarboxylase n=1 Tax=Lignipirellula cremea TaxID=2528010 RepID=A0A518DTH3_9BACT|nr:pyridoxal-dependent decarboxylase [Lignipirellula cremea]QDU95141.1 L-2,4-diaminobutyrate decarboxylase [Lignipirellula cremea]